LLDLVVLIAAAKIDPMQADKKFTGTKRGKHEIKTIKKACKRIAGYIETVRL
jgi:hypothetical protein